MVHSSVSLPTQAQAVANQQATQPLPVSRTPAANNTLCLPPCLPATALVPPPLTLHPLPPSFVPAATTATGAARGLSSSSIDIAHGCHHPRDPPPPGRPCPAPAARAATGCRKHPKPQGLPGKPPSGAPYSSRSSHHCFLPLVSCRLHPHPQGLPKQLPGGLSSSNSRDRSFLL